MGGPAPGFTWVDEPESETVDTSTGPAKGWTWEEPAQKAGEPKPLYAGKKMGEVPKDAGWLKTLFSPSTYGISEPPQRISPKPITAGPHDSSAAFVSGQDVDESLMKPPPEHNLSWLIRNEYGQGDQQPQPPAPEGPPPGIANKPDFARLWLQQQAENAQIPQTDVAAALHALPGATRTVPVAPMPPLEAPAVPGKPLTPVGAPIQTEGVETQPTLISQVGQTLQRPYEAVAEPALRANAAVADWVAANPKVAMLAGPIGGVQQLLQDLGAKPEAIAPVFSGIYRSPGQFAAAIASPEMAPFLLAPGLAALRGPAAAAQLSAAVGAYFSTEGVRGAAEGIKAISDGWDQATPEQKAQMVGQTVGGAFMAVAPIVHSVLTKYGAKEAEARPDEVKQDVQAALNPEEARAAGQPVEAGPTAFPPDVVFPGPKPEEMAPAAAPPIEQPPAVPERLAPQEEPQKTFDEIMYPKTTSAFGSGYLQRTEEPSAAPPSFEKPHGIYTSSADFASPHADLGGDRYIFRKNPDANVLSIDEREDGSIIVRRDAVGAGAGVWALRDLVGQKEFDRLKKLDREELRAFGAQTFPSKDWSKYFDTQEILEGLGGMYARDAGYDAIQLNSTLPEFSEYVGLTKKSMTPVTEPRHPDVTAEALLQAAASPAEHPPVVPERPAPQEQATVPPPVTAPSETPNAPGAKILYHGTRAKFDVFDTTHGAYFSEDPGLARSYAEETRKTQAKASKAGGSPRVIAATIDLRRPLDLTALDPQRPIFSTRDLYVGNQVGTAGRLARLLGNPSPQVMEYALREALGKNFHEGRFSSLYDSDPFRAALFEVFGGYRAETFERTPASFLSGHEVLESGPRENVSPVVKRFLEALGFDGVVLRDSSVSEGPWDAKTARTWVAFRPDQIHKGESPAQEQGPLPPLTEGLTLGEEPTPSGRVAAAAKEAEGGNLELFSKSDLRELTKEPPTPEELAAAEREVNDITVKAPVAAGLTDAETARIQADQAARSEGAGIGRAEDEAARQAETAGATPQEARPENLVQQPGEAVHAGEPERGAGELGPVKPAARPVAKEPWQMTRREYEISRAGPKEFRGPDQLTVKWAKAATRARMEHRDAVSDALRAGKPVSQEVLADYPDLAKLPVGRAVERPVAAAPPVRGAHGVGAAALGEAPEIGSRLFPFLKSKAEPKPKTALSAVAEAKDIFGGHGLNQLEEASPEAAKQARYTASAKQKAQKLVANAIPHLEADLGGGIGSVENFFTYLSWSRLRGIVDKYAAMIDHVKNMPDEDLLVNAKEGTFNNVISALDGRRGFGDRDLEDELSTAIFDAEGPHKDIPELRRFLSDTFNTARENVSTAVLKDKEDPVAYGQRPEVQAALKTYKRLLEEPLRKAHEMNEGIFSKFLGPADTYFPLSQAPDQPGGKRLISTSRAPYAKPKNPNNAFATGLSDQYDTGVDAFRDNLARAIRMNGRAGLISALEESGLMRRLKQGVEPPETTMWNGEEYKAKVVETGVRMMINRDGKVVRTVSPKAVVPEFVAKELNTILEPSLANEESTLRKITDFVTTFNMGGPTDAVYHTANLIGTMILRIPIVGTDIVSKALSVAPFTKFVAGLANILAVHPLDPKWSERYMQMIENGQIPTRAGSVTYSRRLAETTGAEQVHFLQTPWFKNKEGKLKFRSPSDWSPIIFGPNGIDIRARLLLDAIGEHIATNSGITMTPAERFEWTRQLGNYVYQLEGRIERAAKSTGLAPFYTAGRQMNWNGIAGMLSAGHLPVGKGMKAQVFNRYRAMMITSGTVGLVASWAVANKLYRGKWPWEDDESRLFQIAIKPEDRQTALMRAIFGDDLARTAWVNIGVLSPLIARGLRITGARGLIENQMKGMPPAKGVDQASIDILNGWLHPFLGPPARTATAALGFEPSFRSLTNMGHSQPLFRPTVRGKVEPGLAGWGQRGKQLLIQSNPIFRRMQQGKQEEQPWTRTVADTLVPNLFSGPYWQQDTPLDTFLREHATHGAAKSTEEMDQAQRVRGFEARLRTAHESGDKEEEASIRKEIADAASAKKIPGHQVPLISQRAAVGKHVAGFQSLPLKDAVDAFDVATPDQRQELRMAMIKKLAAARSAIGRGRGGALQDMAPGDRAALFQKAQALIKDTPKAPPAAPLRPVGRLFNK